MRCGFEAPQDNFAGGIDRDSNAVHVTEGDGNVR